MKRGQTLGAIAAAFGYLPSALAAFNGLTCEVEEGQVIELPPSAGNTYLVRGGESKTLLCGSPARYLELNGTKCFYPGQRVYLG